MNIIGVVFNVVLLEDTAIELSSQSLPSSLDMRSKAVCFVELAQVYQYFSHLHNVLSSVH